MAVVAQFVAILLLILSHEPVQRDLVVWEPAE